MLNETSEQISIPRGFIGRLLRFCKEQQIGYILEDDRQKVEPVSFKGSTKLRDHQIAAQTAAEKKNFGVIVAPPGSGKTVLSLAIIKDKQQPALILVHRKQLADQWMERIESFLGIPKKEIGCIGSGKNKPGKQITVAMMQSIEKVLGSADALGTIILLEWLLLMNATMYLQKAFNV